MVKSNGGGCRHLGSLPNERRLSEATLVGTPRTAMGALKATNMPHWLCLTCFRSFTNRQTFLQHGRSAGHGLAWASREKDEFNEYIFCVNCKRPIGTDELATKERERVSISIAAIKELLGRDPASDARGNINDSHDDGNKHQTDKAPLGGANEGSQETLATSWKRPPGLHNLGNTCFMNASLQCLASLNSLQWRERDRCGALSIALYDLLKCLRGVACSTSEMSSPARPKGKRRSNSISSSSKSRPKSSVGALNPSHFFDQLRQKYSFFERNEQQDSHDFLRLLFNALDDEITDAGGQLADAPHRRCFEGSTVVRVQCARCRQVTCKREDCLEISLSLSPGVRAKVLPSLETSLESLSLTAHAKGDDRDNDRAESCCTTSMLLESWRQPQLLTENDAFACEGCYRSIGSTSGDVLPPGAQKIDHTQRVVYTTASCQYSMERLPRCLLLHLQRFSLHSSPARRKGNRQQAQFSYGKNHRDVVLPLHLDPLLLLRGGGEESGAPQDTGLRRRYRLKAVVIHEGGTADSGHYVCLVHRDECNATSVTDGNDLNGHAGGQDADGATPVDSNPRDDEDHDHGNGEDEGDGSNSSASPLQTHTGQWYRISDSSVTPIAQATALSVRNAYMVFYELE